MTITEVLSSGSFWIAGAIIQGAQQTAGFVAGQLTPKALASPAGKSAMALQNYVFGVAMAAIPDWLPGEQFGERAMWGLGAGALSHVLHATIIKRLEGAVKAVKDQSDASGGT